MELWTEWKFGIGNNKPASEFTTRERGGMGVPGLRQAHYRRRKLWHLLMDRLVHEEGDTAETACGRIQAAYGVNMSPTAIFKHILEHGIHPIFEPGT